MTRKIENIIAQINKLSNKRNISLITSYYNYLIEKSVASNTQINNLLPVYYFSKHLGDTNLLDIKEKIQVTTYLNTLIKHEDPDKKYITSWNHYLLKLKSFYRWLYNTNSQKDERDWQTPDFLRIRMKETKRISPYSNAEIWDKDEIISILKYEPSIRNKAVITLIWDLDARPHEVVLLKIKNIRLREKYGEGEIPFTAKTGSGPILLTFSFPYVRDWLNIHPDKNNGEAPLICTRKDGTMITTKIVYDVMFRLRNRIKRFMSSGIISDQREKERLEYFINTKKWNPYCIRHSAITADSDYLPEYALKKKVRWSMNSLQGRRYIKNRMGDDLRNKILEQNGIIIDTDLKPKPTTISCPRCDLINQIENKFCSKCSYPLTPQAFEEIKNEEDAKFRGLEEKQNKQMEEMQRKLAKIIEYVDFSKIKQE